MKSQFTKQWSEIDITFESESTDSTKFSFAGIVTFLEF